MNLTRNRIRSIGWAFVLTICLALTVILTLRVNAVKGQVRETENRIVSLQQSIRFLEVEFQTRANQQQLAALNTIEFGYVAPGARQYVEGERQLASLGLPRAAGAPRPIRMTQVGSETGSLAFADMVSPLTGKPIDAADGKAAGKAHAAAPAPGALRQKPVFDPAAKASTGAQTTRYKLAEAQGD